MMTEAQLEAYFDSVNLCCEKGRDFVRRTRAGEPSRAVDGAGISVAVRYSSLKMGFVLALESQEEHAYAKECDWDDDVLEFWDQAPPLTLNYTAANGRPITVIHKDDMLVLARRGVFIVECKPENKLEAIAERSLARYCRDEEGSWRCPPGEQASKPLGITYVVRSSVAINPTEQSNFDFLYDYGRRDAPPVPPDTSETIRKLVEANPTITLAELLESVAESDADAIYALIARRVIHVNLRVALLSHPDKVRVFADRASADAYGRSVMTRLDSGPVEICAGAVFVWDGNKYNAVNVGKEWITLETTDNQLKRVHRAAFENLLFEGAVKHDRAGSAPQENPVVLEILSRASPEHRMKADRRQKILEAWKRGENVTTPGRTLRKWQELARISMEAYGDSYPGLIPKFYLCGRFERRLTDTQLELLKNSVKTDYEKATLPTVAEAFGKYQLASDAAGVPAASYSTYWEEVHRQPKFQQVLARAGARAAYVFEPQFWHLEYDTPRHGERPFQFAHIDHTQVDLEVEVFYKGVKIGTCRPWLTAMMDAFDRVLLAHYLSLDSPSYVACMMVLRECVRRYHRLPQYVIVDRGAEFYSVAFETLLPRFYSSKKTRPSTKARFGSLIERFFGTINTELIHTLEGNTQIMRNVRQVTKSHNPKELTRWSFELFEESLQEYMYDDYNHRLHPALNVTPWQAYEAGMRTTGKREHTIVNEEEFRFESMPTTKTGTAKISSISGVQLQNIRYWSDTFRNPGMHGLVVKNPKYDPENAGYAYLKIRGEWIECRSEYFHALNGISRKEVALISKAIREKKKEDGRRWATVSTREIARRAQANDIKQARDQRVRDEARKRQQAAASEQQNAEEASSKVSEDELDELIRSVPDDDPGEKF